MIGSQLIKIQIIKEDFNMLAITKKINSKDQEL